MAEDMAEDAPIYPLSLHLRGRRVLVVGGGTVAVRRVAGLRAAGAAVTVVAPVLTATLADLAGRGLIAGITREYEPADLDGAWLVFACTDRPEVNAAVAADAERLRIWCVRADDATRSPAWVPAVGRAGGATVAVNAGRDPRRAVALRDRCLEVLATPEAPEAADVQGGTPGSHGRPPQPRIPEGYGADRHAGALGVRGSPPGRHSGGSLPRTGSVAIVGGGPGDPGLITVAGLQRLRGADVVVADRLGPLELLADLPPSVEIIDAAKVPGGPAMRQDDINDTLVRRALAGLSVVRLKGGDPFVFGRGREEVAACLAAGVPVEVIPGVTSAVSVPAAAGIPVTHRGLSQGFIVVAGRASGADPRGSINWQALAASGLTLVLLMAIEHLSASAAALMAAGLPGGTPSACVADGWTRDQRVVLAPLDRLAGAVKEAGLANPAVVVIGDVAQFADPGFAETGPRPPAGGPGSGAAPIAGPTPATTEGPALPTTPGATGPITAGATSPTTPGATPATITPGSTTPTTTAGATPATTTSVPAAWGADRGSGLTGRRVLVLGGARSGKSAAAERMLAGAAAVDYVATGAPAGSGDTDWDARIREHQRRRPPHWRTLETLALPDVLAGAPGDGTPVLVECLTTWLARTMDECGTWDGGPAADRALADRLDALASAWQGTGRQVVAVSSEVGAGVVPDTASGRRFRDELGRLNARLAAVSDEVWYCTAGIPRRLR